MSRRTGLGRGLAALIPPASEEAASHAPRSADTPHSADVPEQTDGPPDGPATAPPPGEAASGSADRSDATSTPTLGMHREEGRDLGYAEIDPERITPNPRQPREVFDPEELEGLATSLADIGMLQPLVVRPLSDGRYELIAGERRWRAARLAGLERVPALVRHTEDADLLKEALVENIHRVQLNPLEEAAAYQQLLQEFDVTQEELATRLGRSRPSISNAIRLLQLPAAVQRRVAAGVLSAGHAKVLLALPDPSEQARLAERIVAEGLSVRATEEHVRLRLTGDTGPRRPPARRQPTAPGLVELQDDLSDALQARVRISMGARKGKLAVEFTSVEELERIVAVIADGLARGPGRGEGEAGSAPAWEADGPLSPWEDEAP
jgi:ParB family transcriptional regulator, chromosome partitioning protein